MFRFFQITVTGHHGWITVTSPAAGVKTTEPGCVNRTHSIRRTAIAQCTVMVIVTM